MLSFDLYINKQHTGGHTHILHILTLWCLFIYMHLAAFLTE